MKIIYTMLFIQIAANVLSIYAVNKRINAVCVVIGRMLNEFVQLHNHIHPTNRIEIEDFLEGEE